MWADREGSVVLGITLGIENGSVDRCAAIGKGDGSGGNTEDGAGGAAGKAVFQCSELGAGSDLCAEK